MIPEDGWGWRSQRACDPVGLLVAILFVKYLLNNIFLGSVLLYLRFWSSSLNQRQKTRPVSCDCTSPGTRVICVED